MKRNANKEGSVRKSDTGKFECVIQSKYVNPDTGKEKRIKRIGNTEQEARKNAKLALKAWEKQIEQGKNIKIDKTKTFGSYMEEYIETVVKTRGITDSTYKSYIYAMNANFYNYKIAKLQLHMLNTVEFEVFYDAIIKEKSAKTAAFPIQLTKQCCTWLYGKSLIEEDYASFAQTKREKRDEYFRKDENEKRAKPQKKVFTDEDIKKFYDSYKNNLSEYSPVIILQLETMLRASEVLNIHLEDVDLEHSTITIRSTISERFIDGKQENGLEKYEKVPKNGKERVIYLSDLAKEVVEYMMEQTKLKCRANPNNLLYPSFWRHGKVRSVDSYEIQFKDLCNKLGIDRDVRVTKTGNKVGLCTHALRHTAITIANTAKNANVVVNALQAGHTAITTENIYTHGRIESQKSIVTPSKAVLDDYKEKPQEEEKELSKEDRELYEMYLKLKDKFE